MPKFPDTRRLVDISLGLMGLAVFGFPIALMTLIAFAESGKSGWFAQKRFGLHGKKFKILKIRTMDRNLNPLPISGEFRKMGLDELPQLFNVIAGDMSIIGPRPHRRFFKNILGWKHILDIKPGLTCLYTVTTKETGAPECNKERARVEGDYVDRRLAGKPCLSLDLKIAYRAAKIVFSGKADCDKRVDCAPGARLDNLTP